MRVASAVKLRVCTDAGVVVFNVALEAWGEKPGLPKTLVPIEFHFAHLLRKIVRLRLHFIRRKSKHRLYREASHLRHVWRNRGDFSCRTGVQNTN